MKRPRLACSTFRDALPVREVACSRYKALANSSEKHVLNTSFGSPKAQTHGEVHALRMRIIDDVRMRMHCAVHSALPRCCPARAPRLLIASLTSLSSARLLRCAGRAAHRHAARLPGSALAPDCAARVKVAGVAVCLQRRLRNVATHAVRIPKLCTACRLSAGCFLRIAARSISCSLGVATGPETTCALFDNNKFQSTSAYHCHAKP